MEQLDQALEELAARKDAWAALPLGTKIDYLAAVRERTAETAGAWTRAAAAAKGLAPDSPMAGEEWLTGPWAVLYSIERYLRTLRRIAVHGPDALVPPHVRAREDGRVVAQVFPAGAYDRALFTGIRAEVWMQPGVTRRTLPQAMASFYRERAPAGRVVLVLGAGNIASIAPLDLLHAFVARGAVCALKMNPVNAYLGPFIEQAFEPFVTAGYLRVLYGGADAGAYLCAHELVDAIHVTGSAQTHDAIVRALDRRKPITSELGNVSPTIVLPGDWSERDLRFQAEHIATQKLHNGGFNCIAAQVLVLPREWDGTPRLLEAVERALRAAPARPAYYPGAAQRRAAILAARPQHAPLAADRPAPALVRADPSDPGDPALNGEAFCNVLAYVELPGREDAYLRAAVEFANERLPGTLGANLLADPRTQRRLRGPLDAALAALRYGCIGVNAWTGVGFLLADLPWGAYPGHSLERPGSGIGVVHNAWLFDRSEKSVVYAPFRPIGPPPPWFLTNRMQAVVGERLCAFETHRDLPHALAVVAAALRA